MKKALVFFLAPVILALSACGKPAPMGADSAAEQGVSADAQSEAGPTTEEAAKNNAAILASDVHIIQFDAPAPGDLIAVIHTTGGEIRARLFNGEAPKTVEAFTALAKSGFYSGQSFNSVINGYKIECGVAGNGGGFPEKREFSLNLWNFRGALSLSNNGADFMIVQAPQCLNPKTELEALNFPVKVIERYLEEGGAPHQDWENTVFGAVISGMEVVDQIAAATQDENGKPVTSVKITDIQIMQAQ